MHKRVFLLLIILLVSLQVVQAQDLPSNIIPAAIEAANEALPSLGQPVTWSWQLFLNVNNSNLGCPLVTGETLPNPISTYRISLTFGADIYIVYVSADATRTQLCDAKFPSLGPAATPTSTVTPATPIPTATMGVCTLRPASVFANVRTLPQENATIITTLPENTVRNVTGRLADNTWYFIDEGWVSFSVVILSGDCGAVPTLGANVQSQATPSAPNTINTSQYLCQPDGTVYLPTRLQRGQATARIDSGGIPNRLREEPSINGVFIMDIQPGRTLDRLIDGPACNDGYTWWYVEIDGQRGWTAESNAAENDYYIVPVEGFELQPLAPGRVLTGFTAASADIAFSPDGRVLASAGNSEIPLWRVADDTRLETNPEPTFAVYRILFHPDGTLLAADESGAVRFYDIANNSEFVPFEGILDPKWASFMALHPDGASIAVSGCARPGQLSDCQLGYARVYNLATEELVQELQGHNYAVTKLLFSPDGSLLATLGRDDIWLWDTGTWEQVAIIPTALFSSDMAFSPDASLIITSACSEEAIKNNIRSCNMGEVRVWDTETDSVIELIPHPSEVFAVAFSPDGALIASGSEDGIVRLWDAETFTLITEYKGHTAAVRDVAFNPAGTLLASSSADNIIRLWEVGQ